MKPKPTKDEQKIKRMTQALRADSRYCPISRPPAATERTLREVWRLWNLLPPDWPAEPRASLLKISGLRRFREEHARLSGQRERVATEPWDVSTDGPKPKHVSARFLKAWSKPFGHDYHGAIGEAQWWHKFAREDYPGAVVLREQRGHTELFNCAKNVPGADKHLAAWRTGRELIARKHIELDAASGREQVPLTEFCTLESPPLGLINYARRRCEEYRKAHDKTRDRLAKISWPLDFGDLYSPADAYVVAKKFGDQVSDDCKRRAVGLLPQDQELLDDPARMVAFMSAAPQVATINKNVQGRTGADWFGGFWKLGRKDQRDFLKRTHRHSQHWKSACRVAIRYSAGLCSQADFAAEMNCVFPQLPLDEKLKFLDFCAGSSGPTAQKTNRLALLCAWAAFNAPVFREFGWHRDAIYTVAAKTLGLEDWPKSAARMFEIFSREGIKMNLNNDREHLTARRCEELLEIPPLKLL